MIGQRLLHYQLTRRLGSGGQATAYLAKDTKLGRAVVLKLLDDESAANDAVRKRFLREARLAATLDHPCICTIHEISEADGHHFIVMQYIDGETLKELLARTRLPLESALAIGVQVADGLAAAHAAGVVHRDVKPANVIISSTGRPVIVDFGLAKALPAAHSAELDVTQTTAGGKPFGTPTSMSPEQVRGELDVDARSDVFSFGIILYEMLSGVKPFAGKSAVETMHAILNTPPRPLSELVPSLPPRLCEIVARALEKSPAKRYSTAGELHDDLRAVAREQGLEDIAALQSLVATTRQPAGLGRRLMASAIELMQSATMLLQSRTRPRSAPAKKPTAESSASRAPSKLSIAILPLAHIGAESQYEHFGVGLADTLISELAVIGDLFVRPLRTVLKYVNQQVDPLAVGVDMGVDVVLDGSFQVAGPTLRATLRLFDVRNGADLWNERFDYPVADLFALQDQVAQRVIEHLRIRLTDYEKEQLRTGPAGDATAYDNYIRARYLFERSHERRDYDDAIALFRRAVEADPGFAPAHSGLGRAWLMLWFVYRSDLGWLDEAEAACHLAIHANPNFAEAHSVLASVELERGDKDAAYHHLEAALALAPNDLESHIALGWLYRWSGLLDRAIRCYKMAIKIDPSYWRNYWGLAMSHVYLGDLDTAMRQVEHFLTRIDPQNPVLRFVQADICFYQGNYDVAARVGEGMKAAAPDLPFGAVLLAKIYAAQGLADRADAELATVTRLVGTRGDSYYWMAQIRALQGRADQAIEQLKVAIEMGNENIPFVDRDRCLDAIRAEPAFEAAVAPARERCISYAQKFVL